MNGVRRAWDAVMGLAHRCLWELSYGNPWWAVVLTFGLVLLLGSVLWLVAFAT